MARKYGRSAPSASRSRWMQLKYPGVCKVCGESLPAGTLAYWDSAAKTVTCHGIACCEADGLTETVERRAGNPDGKLTRRETHVGSGAPVHPAAQSRPRVVATTFNSGATVYQNSRGRCIDAPCCGCCS
jgi:hypothetical protein